ncbi:hypothetical protein NJ7G_3327 [Natrinema sp. J7-2]|nr:hypothetical protein NJ7G_3327 [Natrinema sp. J7-2]
MTNGDGTGRQYPNGHCQRCGEPLRLSPCLNCGWTNRATDGR